MTRHVPIRELRNNTAGVLRQVRTGESMTITQNGVPVAELGPLRTTGVPMPKSELLALLRQTRVDPTFAADIAVLTADTTDDLDPIE